MDWSTILLKLFSRVVTTIAVQHIMSALIDSLCCWIDLIATLFMPSMRVGHVFEIWLSDHFSQFDLFERSFGWNDIYHREWCHSVLIVEHTSLTSSQNGNFTYSDFLLTVLSRFKLRSYFFWVRSSFLLECSSADIAIKLLCQYSIPRSLFFLYWILLRAFYSA